MAKRTPQSIIGPGSLQAVISYTAFDPGRETFLTPRSLPDTGALMHFVPIIT